MKEPRDQRIHSDHEWAKAKLRWVLCRIAIEIDADAPEAALAIWDMLRRQQ